ncbi:MAG: hypothetical protein M3P00_09200 [Gemmatimonadota bacterium]|nr:hypothetical protein [Gemmatimonadota bacterium]
MSYYPQAVDLTGFHRGGDLGDPGVEIVEKKLRQLARKLLIATDDSHQGGFVERIRINFVTGLHTGQ